MYFLQKSHSLAAQRRKYWKPVFKNTEICWFTLEFLQFCIILAKNWNFSESARQIRVSARHSQESASFFKLKKSARVGTVKKNYGQMSRPGSYLQILRKSAVERLESFEKRMIKHNPTKMHLRRDYENECPDKMKWKEKANANFRWCIEIIELYGTILRLLGFTQLGG